MPELPSLFSEPTGTPAEPPDYTTAYKTWSTDRSPQNTGVLLKSLDPVFNTAISRYAGGKDDALIRSRARRLALDAVKTYDPRKGTRLNTHVMNHLQGLRRITRQQQQFFRVPERASMEQAHLQRAEAELEETLGREPSAAELADYSSFSTQKIERLKLYTPGVPESSLPDAHDLSVASPYSPAGRDQQIAQLVYEELAPRDQKIMEWSLGMHGAKTLDNTTIASKLRLTPGAISQRKKIIQQKLDQMLGSEV